MAVCRPTKAQRLDVLPLAEEFHVSTRRHVQRPSRLAIDQPQIFEDQAFWFLSLPNKIKRHHFSRAEQVVLTDRCESVLRERSDGSTPEPLRQVETTSGGRCPTLVLRKQLFTSASAALNDKCRAIIAAVENSWHSKVYGNKEMPEPDPRDLTR